MTLLSIHKPPWVPIPTDPSPVICSKPLSAERQWYLFNQIQIFCPDVDIDVTCPLPSILMPSSRSCSTVLPTHTEELTDSGHNGVGSHDTRAELPPWNRRYVCGV